MFMPGQPRSGALTSSPVGEAEMETLASAAFYMNEGILVTPFHTMLLMCPATTVGDVVKHTAVFSRFTIDLLRKAKAV